MFTPPWGNFSFFAPPPKPDPGFAQYLLGVNAQSSGPSLTQYGTDEHGNQYIYSEYPDGTWICDTYDANHNLIEHKVGRLDDGTLADQYRETSGMKTPTPTEPPKDHIPEPPDPEEHPLQAAFKEFWEGFQARMQNRMGWDGTQIQAYQHAVNAEEEAAKKAAEAPDAGLLSAQEKIRNAVENFDPSRIPKSRIDEMLQNGQAVLVRNPKNPAESVIVISATNSEGKTYYIFLERNQIKQAWPYRAKLDSTYSIVDSADSLPYGTPQRAAFNRIFDWDDVTRKNRKAMIATFLLHIIPLGAAVDQFQEGEYSEGAVSAIGDTLLFASLLNKGVKAARIVAAANGAVKGGLAAYRGYNGIQKLVNGDTLGAAGDAGEVVLRLLGVSLSAAELKALRGFRNIDSSSQVDLLSSKAKKHILYGDGPGSEEHLWPGQLNRTSTLPE